MLYELFLIERVSFYPGRGVFIYYLLHAYITTFSRQLQEIEVVLNIQENPKIFDYSEKQCGGNIPPISQSQIKLCTEPFHLIAVFITE